MKARSCLSIVAPTVALALLAMPLAARADSGTLYISPVVGIESFGSSVGLDQGPVYGLSGMQQFTDHLGVELSYLHSSPDVHQGNGSTDVDQLILRGIYSLGRMGYQDRYEPYFSLGVAGVHYDPPGGGSDGETELGAGLGVRFHVNDRVSASLGAEQRYGTTNYYQATLYLLSLNFAFGGAEQPAPAPEPVAAPAPVAAPPADSDGDGVPDSRDKCPNTPRGREVDANGCEYHLKKTEEMRLNILFDTNKAIIKPAYQTEVERAAKFLKRYANVDAVIEGHTDSQGKAAYNMKLSQARADAVRSMLINQYGIDPSRLTATGFGETRPIASNKTADGRAQNRRVVAVFKAEVDVDPNKH